MVAAFDYCLHGKGGAAPSIDTAMHGLVDAAHVDHLHPDSGIALATAADGEKLTEQCFGDRVVWVPWRRPGFQLGPGHRRDQGGEPAGHRLHPRRARHHRLGRHHRAGGGELAGDHPHRASSSWPTTASAEPFGAGRARVRAAAGGGAAGEGGRDLPRPSAASPPPTGRRSGTTPTARWCWSSCPGRSCAALAELGTSCPDHFLRTKVKPLVVDLPGDRVGGGDHRPGCRSCTRPTGPTTRATTTATPPPTRPAIRGADPAIVLVPGVGMFSFGKDKQTARVAGEFYVNAINVMRGAESVSHLRARSARRRSSPSSTGRWRRPSCSGCRSRRRWPPGSRW